MDSQDIRNLSEAYNFIYEQQIGVPLKDSSDRAAKDQLKRMIPKGEKIYTPKSSLQNAAYEPEGEYVEEDIRNRDVLARGGFDPRFDKKPKKTNGNFTKTGPTTPTTTTTTPKPTTTTPATPKPNTTTSKPTTTTSKPQSRPGILGALDKFARDRVGDIGGKIGEIQGRTGGRKNAQGYYDKAKETVKGTLQRIGSGIRRLLGQEYEHEALGIIFEYLIYEGYANDDYDALVIMANMSEEWMGTIIKEEVIAQGKKNIDEMAMNPNSRFLTMAQQKDYAANQIGSKEFSDRGGYAALKAGGGQAALKSGSRVSDVLHAGRRALAAKRSQEFRSAFNKRFSGANKPAATAPTKKPMDDFTAGGGNAKMKKTGMTRDQVVALGQKNLANKKNLANSYEPDNFDVILEYLVAEGYADTNENALVIMANMSEEWKETILEAEVLAQKGGVPGSVKVRPSISIPGTSIGIGPNKPVPGTFTTTTPGQREKIKQGDTQIDTGVGGMKPREGAGPTSSERQRYNRQAIRTGAKPMAQ